MILFVGLVFYLGYSALSKFDVSEFTPNVMMLITACFTVLVVYYVIDRNLRKGLRVGYVFDDGATTVKIEKNEAGDLMYSVYKLTLISVDKQGTCTYLAESTVKRKITPKKTDKYVYYNVYSKRIILPSGKVSKRN